MSVSHVRSISYRLHKPPSFFSGSRRVNVPPHCSRRGHLGYPCNAFAVDPTHTELSNFLSVCFHFQSKVRERSKEACSRSSSPRIQIRNGSYLWSDIRTIFFLVWVSAIFSWVHSTQKFSRWTSFPTVSYWVPLMSGLPVGFSISWIFVGHTYLKFLVIVLKWKVLQLSLFNYIIDAYLSFAASAIAGSIVCRSFAGAAFPVSSVVSSYQIIFWLQIWCKSYSQAICTIS